MFNKIQKSIGFSFILTGFLLLSTESAVSQQVNHHERAKRFLDESGMMHQLREIPHIIMGQFEEEGSKFDMETRQKIAATLTSAFEEEKLVDDAISYLLNDIEAGHIQTVMDWLEHPLTQRMNELEIISNSDSLESSRYDYFENIENNLPDQSRIDMILEFDELTNATDNTVYFIADLYLAMVTAMNPYVPTAEKVSMEDIPIVRGLIIREMHESYKNVTIGMNLFTYRTVTDPDLLAYFDFYRTPAGSWFSDVSYGVFENVLKKATSRVREINGYDNE
ncbi:MAG TPA: hypothetical protein DCE78_09835 [Bacteroidetes bacterium]|nr:hypothetical protein [Bacteroidota bacterium]